MVENSKQANKQIGLSFKPTYSLVVNESEEEVTLFNHLPHNSEF